ncbi:MAG: RNA-binding S4 domain-containing protein [Ruminococcaceae bacterium]|nr:RNA-binding S4 domain-containing protein [Oscillospiraceae bacterium]
MEQIIISTPFIKLDQFLKFAGVVEVGTDAKFLATGGFIKVNGKLETRRGRKLYPGDEVAVDYEDDHIRLQVCES